MEELVVSAIVSGIKSHILITCMCLFLHPLRGLFIMSYNSMALLCRMENKASIAKKPLQDIRFKPELLLNEYDSNTEIHGLFITG